MALLAIATNVAHNIAIKQPPHLIYLMKNVFFAFALLLLCMGTALAQTTTEPSPSNPLQDLYKRKAVSEGTYKQLYYGGRIGVALSNLGGDTDSTSNRTGLLIGAFAGADLNAKVSVQVGLNYVKRGAQISSDSLRIGASITPHPNATGADATTGTPFNANYNYLSVPVSIQYFPMEENGFFLSGGVSASLLIRAKIAGVGGNFVAQEGYIDVKDQLNSLDFGLQAGLGYEWMTHLGFVINYQYGLGNTLASNIQGLAVNNQGWQASIAYKF